MRSFVEELRPVFDWVQREPGADQIELLDRFTRWLGDEAIPAGGIGPREAERLIPRHVGDSLVFAYPWRDDLAPNELIDIGSGAGLPGIPLAILFPDCQVTLLDRGGRRIRLLERACRVLGLDNVSIVSQDAASLDELWRAMVFRGSLRLPNAAELIRRCLLPAGMAVFGYSTRPDPPPVPSLPGLSTELITVPPQVLGHSPSILSIRKDDGTN